MCAPNASGPAQLNRKAILRFLVDEIHSVAAATVDAQGLSVTCAADVMDCDEYGLYFITARGKGFYRRLKARGYLALTGLRGRGTMSCTAVSVRGRVRELGPGPLPRLLEKNPYMNKIYPTVESRAVLTVFQLYTGSGEWFDLSKTPIERATFTIGGGVPEGGGYFISGRCDGCGLCAAACPQGCIDLTAVPAVIRQQNCLRCGGCQAVCPRNAVIKEE